MTVGGDVLRRNFRRLFDFGVLLLRRFAVREQLGYPVYFILTSTLHLSFLEESPWSLCLSVSKRNTFP